jgi:hypothetical protein
MKKVTRLPITPEATVRRMLRSHTIDEALYAAYDYRDNLHTPGSDGYKFWSEVIRLMERPNALG